MLSGHRGNNTWFWILLAVWVFYSVGWGLGMGLYAVPTIANYHEDTCVVDSCSSETCTRTICTNVAKVTVCMPQSYTCSTFNVHLESGNGAYSLTQDSGCDEPGTRKKCYYESDRINQTLSLTHQVSVGAVCVIVIIGFFWILLTIWLACTWR